MKRFYFWKRWVIRLKRGKSCIKSLKWLKKKRGTINPQNNDDKSFQYTKTVALNYNKF